MNPARRLAFQERNMMKLPRRRQFLASGRGRCRAAGRVALRLGASLSDAAGAHCRWFRARRAGPTSTRASSVNGCRSGSASHSSSRTGRAPAAISPPRRSCVRPPDGYTLVMTALSERDQRDALRQAQFQFHPRHRAGREPSCRDALCHGGESVGSGQDGSRVHRLCQGQSRQDQYGVGRQRDSAPHGGRAVQDDDRRRHGARALSRRGAGADRPDRRAGAGHVRCPSRRRSSTSGPASCARWR